jgi:D-sedoheptulose 7-phosphate isomerase
MSELTARTNDEGWNGVFDSWLRVSRLNAKDVLLVFSVGGGTLEKGVSARIHCSGSRHLRDCAGNQSFACNPHTEAFQAVVWHLTISHPDIKWVETRRESVH